MENVNELDTIYEEALLRRMTNSDEVNNEEFVSIVSETYGLHKFTNGLTSDLDLFIKIIKDKQGLKRVMAIWGITEDVDTILFYPIMMRFFQIMTHEHGYDLASRVLNVCNIQHKKLFCQMTYRDAIALAKNVNGCVIVKKVITLADDLFKDQFLDLIVDHANKLGMADLGRSLIKHMLKLDFTRKTTEDNLHLHELMAEFDDILSTSDTVDRIHKVVSKLTSDSDLFVEFVKTRRGLLIAQIILGKLEEIDTMFFEASKQRFTDVATNLYGHRILFQTIYVLKKRGNVKVCSKLARLIAVHALHLIKHPIGYLDVQEVIVQELIHHHNKFFTKLLASGLQCHYIELSFLEHGSNILEKLLSDDTRHWPLMFMVMEIVKCDEDILVKLAKDEYGNKVLKKTLEVAKKYRVDFFGDLVEKLKPFIDRLRGTQGENIAAVIESVSDQSETVKDPTVSEGSN